LTHGGGAGTFEINLPLTGQPGVECRSASGNFTIVLTFNTPVNGGSAGVSSGNVSNVAFSGDEMIVSLTGIANQQVVTLTATNITGQNGDSISSASVNIGFLAGDTTGNGTVNSSDISQTKAASGTAANATNFRTDVTVNGFINSSDVSTVKIQSGTALPTSP
jgi:hypothetical protein